MKPVRTGRWFAIGTAAALAGLTFAGPAAAQPGVSLDIYVGDVVVAADGESETRVSIRPSSAATFENLRVTYDFSGLDGVATVSAVRPGCSTTGQVLECVEHSQEIGEGGLGAFPVDVIAEPGAVPGDSGPLAVTVEADGVSPASGDATVTVGAPVSFFGDLQPLGVVEPGDMLEIEPTLRNDGPEAADGAVAEIFVRFTLQIDTRYSNCLYLDGSGAASVLCSFESVIETGQLYEFDSPMELLVGDDTPAPGMVGVEGRWLTTAEADARLAELASRGFTPVLGDGPALNLLREDGQPPAPAPADPVPAANAELEGRSFSGFAEVIGDSVPDFAAVGDTAAGNVGDEVSIRVGVENVGTATFDGSFAPAAANYVLVVIPEGTTAVAVDGRCAPTDADRSYDWDHLGQPEAAEYLCRTGFVLVAGEAELFDFTLRIDSGDSDAVGAVEVNQLNPEMGPTKPEDVNPANDVAEIVISVGDGGEGGELPVTGGVVAAASGIGLVPGTARCRTPASLATRTVREE